MTDINDLRERVESAEQRFGLMDEQQRHYSERLIGLIETIEAQLQAARTEIEMQVEENLRLGRDLTAARGEVEEQIEARRRLDEELTAARADAETQTDANLRLSQENEELRGMLHSLLRSIEQKTHMKTLQDLEARVTGLVTRAAATVPAPTEVAIAGGDTAAEIVEIETVIEAPEPEEAATMDLVVEAADDAPADGEVTDGEVSDGEVTDDGITDDGTAGDLPADAEAEVEATMATEPSEPELPVEDSGAEAVGEPLDQAAPETEILTEVAEPEAAAESEPDDVLAAIAGLDASDEALADMPSDETAANEAERAEPQEAMAADAGETGETGTETAAGGTEPAAPTVKEIIRRVGDLARELERAEAVRRASRAAETLAPEPPPFGRAANG